VDLVRAGSALHERCDADEGHGEEGCEVVDVCGRIDLSRRLRSFQRRAECHREAFEVRVDSAAAGCVEDRSLDGGVAE
jgi:hypothetical protein